MLFLCINSFNYADIDIGWKQPILIQLSENTQTAKLHFLKRKKFSFFEDPENYPKITTLLPRTITRKFSIGGLTF